METPSDNDRTKILIDMSNQLIGEAIKLLLTEVSDLFEIAVATDSSDQDGAPPHKIIVDAHTLAHDHFARWPDTKLVLIDTGLPEETIISILFSHKLHGIIATDTTPGLFVKALVAIRDGQIWIDNRKVKAVLRSIESTRKFSLHDRLSRREREIIVLVSQGFRNRDIADRLCVSEQTVKTHISRIFRKCDVTSRSQLVPLAMKYRMPNIL